MDDLFSRKLEIVDAKEETQEHDDEVVEPKLKARRANASESTPQEKEVELRRKCRTLFVGNLDINAQNKDIIKLFKAYGQVPPLPTIRSKRFGSVPSLSTEPPRLRSPSCLSKQLC